VSLHRGGILRQAKIACSARTAEADTKAAGVIGISQEGFSEVEIQFGSNLGPNLNLFFSSSR
jgi:hypothetical protein